MHKDGNGQRLELSQTITIKGTFKLSAVAFRYENKGNTYIQFNSESYRAAVSENNSWQSISVSFTSDGSKTTKITCGAWHGNNNSNYIAGFDNVKLEWNLTQSLTGLLTDANTFYDANTSYSALKTVIDATNTSSTDADDLEAQYNTLDAALELARAQKQWKEVWDELDALDETALPNAAKSAITTELAKSVPTTTASDVNTAKAALQALIDSYDGIKASYDKVKALITLATNEKDNSAGAADAKSTLATAIGTATTNIETRTAANDLISDYNTLETARRTYVTSGAEPTAGHPFDWTFKLSNSSFESGTTGWTLSKETTGSWTYEAESYDPVPVDGVRCLNAWASQINFIEVYQNVTLPMGRYSLKGYLYSTGKKAQHIYAYITSDNSSSNLSSSDAWEQLTANFTQSSSSNTSVKLGIYSQGNNVNNDTNGWFRADYFQLFYNGLKPILNDVIDNAIDISTINVGSNPFQIPSSAATTLSGAIAAAQVVYNDADAYGDDIQNAIDALNLAITNYKNATLNAPDEDDAYNLYLADGGSSYAHNLTFLKGNDDAGTYKMSFTTADAQPFYNQAVHFKQVSGNKYNLYIKDATNTPYYICTGAGGGYTSGTTEQIRVTTDDTKALGVLLVASNTEDGAYYLKNTESDNALIGTSDGGFYTVTSKNKFNINPASTVSVPVKIGEGKTWGTCIFPFDPTLPTDVVAYSAVVNGNAIELTEVVTPVANVPYILKNNTGAEVNTNLTGYGVAKEDHYTVGALTGIYTKQEIPANSYVLQTQGGVQGFYKLSAKLIADNSVPYRAYLTSTSLVKAFYLDFDDTTGIDSVNGAIEGLLEGEVYDLSGRLVKNPTRGIYIVNGKKVLIK